MFFVEVVTVITRTLRRKICCDIFYVKLLKVKNKYDIVYTILIKFPRLSIL